MKKKFYQLSKKSLKENKVKTFKGLWDKLKKNYQGISTCLDTNFKAKKGTDNKFSVTMSTDKEDRHREIVMQKWDLKDFKKNPVLLDSHNYDSIEQILGKVNMVKVKDGKLTGLVEFMLDNPKGLLAYKMVKGGFLNATSVGFIPKKFDKKGNIEKSELLELSAVSVPANPEALFEKKLEKKVKKIEKEEQEKKKLKKLEALKRLTDKKEKRKKEILKESLAVIQRLHSLKVDNVAKKRQMVNRVIKQLIKIK